MKKNLNIITIICLILGILMGILLPEQIQKLSFIGTIYINLLKFMIIPIIFTTITVTIYNSAKVKGKLIAKTIILFILMFATTFIITSLVVTIFKPGINFTFEETEWTGAFAKFNLSEIFINLFPTNIVTMIQNNAVFPTIIFSILCGICSLKIDDGKKLINIIELFKNLFSKILEYIMYLTPIAVFSIMGTTIATYGNLILGICAKYIGIAYLCSLITMIIVMILPVWIIAKINPIKYIKKIYKIWIITLTTCSSSATLPYTIKTCNEELNIPSKITNIVVPLGCTIHMCGGAVSFALLGLFCSQIYGIDINIQTYIIMLVSATLINMAAPGIPNGGIVIGATYLSLLNIPLTFIGMYSGMYKILDMAYTTLNVTGDITANVIINEKN